MRALPAIVALGLALGGCAAQQLATAKSEYVASTEAYKACLAATSDPRNCESARLAMEADERKLANSQLPGSGQIRVLAPH